MWYLCFMTSMLGKGMSVTMQTSDLTGEDNQQGVAQMSQKVILPMSSQMPLDSPCDSGIFKCADVSPVQHSADMDTLCNSLLSLACSFHFYPYSLLWNCLYLSTPLHNLVCWYL